MKNFIIGFICGMLIVGTAWAAASITLVSGSTGDALGTSSNPMYVTS